MAGANPTNRTRVLSSLMDRQAVVNDNTGRRPMISVVLIVVGSTIINGLTMGSGK